MQSVSYSCPTAFSEKTIVDSQVDRNDDSKGFREANSRMPFKKIWVEAPNRTLRPTRSRIGKIWDSFASPRFLQMIKVVLGDGKICYDIAKDAD